MYGSMGLHYEATTAQWVTAYNSVAADDETFVWHEISSSALV